MTRRCILNVAVNAGGWATGQQRLWESLEERHEGATRLFFEQVYPPGCPDHSVAPYAFKPYAFARARELGHDQALWLDASCWLRKPLDDIWAVIDGDGYYLEPDGNMVGVWTSDACLELLGLSRDEAMVMPLIEGKCIGLDFRDATANAWLDEWLKLADAGGFAGAWTNENGQVSSDPRCRGHRHDISCGSPLADSFGMRLQPCKRVWFPGDGDAPDHAPLYAQGL